MQYNAAFIIDLGSVPADDIVADGNGKYRCDGVRRSVVQECDGSWKVAGEVSAKYVPKESEKVLVKKYWVHRKHADFSRRTFFLLDANHRIVNNVILLHYIFSGEEHCIELSSHGNSKCGRPFSKLRPSVRSKLSHKIMNSSPAQACHDILAEQGGIENILSVNSLPSEQNVYNMKRRRYTGNCDEWGALLDWSLEDEGKAFVWKIEEFPNPIVVLCTEQQLEDLVKFTTGDCEHCIMCVDPTFSLGKFNVTPISYKHLCLQKSCTDASQPVMTGPIMIHYSKSTEVYQTFFDTLVKLRPQLRALKAFETDGELALIEALGTVFPDAVPLWSFRHFQQNVIDCLQKQS